MVGLRLGGSQLKQGLRICARLPLRVEASDANASCLHGQGAFTEAWRVTSTCSGCLACVRGGLACAKACVHAMPFPLIRVGVW